MAVSAVDGRRPQAAKVIASLARRSTQLIRRTRATSPADLEGGAHASPFLFAVAQDADECSGSISSVIEPSLRCHRPVMGILDLLEFTTLQREFCLVDRAKLRLWS